MFCINCGSKVEEGSKFCPHCGINFGVESLISKKENKTEQIDRISIDSIRETVEEYQSRTNIKSKEEAKKYLSQLKAMFWIVSLSMIFMRIIGELESELTVILFIPYIGLLIYFIIFSVKVLKAEKLSGANALWCIFFAPISWFYLYPLMADPLKIILGKKQPPVRLSEMEIKQKAAKTVAANKRFWRNFWMIVGVVLGVLAIGSIIIFILV